MKSSEAMILAVMNAILSNCVVRQFNILFISYIISLITYYVTIRMITASCLEIIRVSYGTITSLSRDTVWSHIEDPWAEKS